MNVLLLTFIIYLNLKQVSGQTSRPDYAPNNTNDAMILGYIVAGIFSFAFLMILIYAIRRYNYCYISSCINTICPEICISSCCNVCDEAKYLNNEQNQESWCCCCESCLTLFECEDNTLYSQYLEKVVYGEENETYMTFSEYKSESILRNSLIENDHKFMLRNKELEHEDYSSDDEDIPLFDSRITIND